MNNKGIIVIGMHRSGTSALSGELSRLGVFMGKNLVKAMEGINDKGYWENSKLLNINEQFLDDLHSSWDDPMATSKIAVQLLEDQQKLNQGVEFIKDEYGHCQLWGMKDPRVSILLPYWKQVFEIVGNKPNYLLMLRHPLEVAGSLSKRDAMSQEKGLMLWLNYNFSSYLEVRSDNFLVIDFQDLLRSPMEISKNIAERFGLSFEKHKESDSFINNKLKRQKVDELKLQQQSFLFTLAKKLYYALKVGDNPEIDSLYDEYRQYLNGLDSVLVEHMKSVKQSEVHFRTVFEDAYYSKYWKIFSGLRKLEKKLCVFNLD